MARAIAAPDQGMAHFGQDVLECAKPRRMTLPIDRAPASSPIAPLLIATLLIATLLIAPGRMATELMAADPAVGAATSKAITYLLHPSKSEILVRTDRSGLLSFAGHRHVIRAEVFKGKIEWPLGEGVQRPRVSFLEAKIGI